jgi:hypothetical protein
LPEIEIGQRVDIVLEQGVIKPSSIQDIMDDRIVLLQISPPLSDVYIDKTILITYLTREDRHVRRCFRARIVEIREGYVTVGRGFPVIIVTNISPSEVCDLRAHQRQQPQPEIKIRFGADYLELIDISSGGAHIVRSAGKRTILKVGDTILLTIERGTEEYRRQARILRQWHTRGTKGPEHLAVIFTAEKLTCWNSPRK